MIIGTGEERFFRPSDKKVVVIHRAARDNLVKHGAGTRDGHFVVRAPPDHKGLAR